MATYNAALAGGVDPSDAYGLRQTFGFQGDWEEGETWGITITDDFGAVLIGPGDVSLLAGTFALSLDNRVWLCAGNKCYYSAIADSTGWNEQDVGAGYLTPSNWYSAPADLNALASYQGKLALFSTNTIWIYTIDADPDLFEKTQVLPNVGTIAPLSVQSHGDMDVFFLHESGVRSLRTRDSFENAMIVDIGSPIDLTLRAIFDAGLSNKESACAVVEPYSNRYWIFIKDTIYVLSYFPSLRIVAWSTYKATYSVDGEQTSFTPVKFVVYSGVIYILANNGKIFKYDQTAYDNCEATVQTPWLDGKKPATMKSATGLQVACSGAWNISAGMSYLEPTDLVTVVTAASAGTFDYGVHPMEGVGTHFMVKAVTTGSAAAKLSSITFHYNEGAGVP